MKLSSLELKQKIRLGVLKKIGWIGSGKANKISGRIFWRKEKKT